MEEDAAMQPFVLYAFVVCGNLTNDWVFVWAAYFSSLGCQDSFGCSTIVIVPLLGVLWYAELAVKLKLLSLCFQHYEFSAHTFKAATI